MNQASVHGILTTKTTSVTVEFPSFVTRAVEKGEILHGKFADF